MPAAEHPNLCSMCIVLCYMFFKVEMIGLSPRPEKCLSAGRVHMTCLLGARCNSNIMIQLGILRGDIRFAQYQNGVRNHPQKTTLPFILTCQCSGAGPLKSLCCGLFLPRDQKERSKGFSWCQHL